MNIGFVNFDLPLFRFYKFRLYVSKCYWRNKVSIVDKWKIINFYCYYVCLFFKYLIQVFVKSFSFTCETLSTANNDFFMLEDKMEGVLVGESARGPFLSFLKNGIFSTCIRVLYSDHCILLLFGHLFVIVTMLRSLFFRLGI